MTRMVRINRDRLWDSHMELRQIGTYDDEATGLHGVRRLALTDAGIQTLRDIEVGFFTEEEGVRFGTDMLGSAVTAGRIPLDHAHKLTDDAGKTVPRVLHPEACANGTDVLANAVLRLASQP